MQLQQNLNQIPAHTSCCCCCCCWNGGTQFSLSHSRWSLSSSLENSICSLDTLKYTANLPFPKSCVMCPSHQPSLWNASTSSPNLNSLPVSAGGSGRSWWRLNCSLSRFDPRSSANRLSYSTKNLSAPTRRTTVPENQEPRKPSSSELTSTLEPALKKSDEDFGALGLGAMGFWV